MAASARSLQDWFDKGVEQGATHMVVKCDTFEFRGGPDDGCCYPIYCKSAEEAYEKAHDGGDRLMEVYNLRKPKDPQFATRQRVFDYEDVL